MYISLFRILVYQGGRIPDRPRPGAAASAAAAVRRNPVVLRRALQSRIRCPEFNSQRMRTRLIVFFKSLAPDRDSRASRFRGIILAPFQLHTVYKDVLKLIKQTLRDNQPVGGSALG